MADALEDDFVLSDGEYTGAMSAARSVAEAGDATMSDGHAKRKPETLSSRAGVENEEQEKRSRKKRKLKQRDKAKKAKKAAANLAVEPGAVSRFPPDMQADHLRKLMRSCGQFSKLTDIELDELGLTEPMLIDTSTLGVERTADTLAAFIRSATPSAADSAFAAVRENHNTGQPCILVVTGNAQRAADLARALRPLSPGAGGEAKERGGKRTQKTAVAKLFARHFKIAEQQEFLQTHICPLAVGTPQRIQDLLQHGLSFERLQCILLDASWVDQKQRTMLDGIETRQALFSLLTAEAVQAKLRTQSKKQQHERARIALF